jgi:hypothetical protein
MNSDRKSPETRRRSFLVALVAGTAGLVAFPFRLALRRNKEERVTAGDPLTVRPHPDAVPRTTRGSSTHV